MIDTMALSFHVVEQCVNIYYTMTGALHFGKGVMHSFFDGCLSQPWNATAIVRIMVMR
jgi:hypothetical protein